MFQWFKRNDSKLSEPVYTKFKRGFRLSKKTKHKYEMDAALYWNGKRMGVIPVNMMASSKASARKTVENEIEIKVEKINKRKT